MLTLTNPAMGFYLDSFGVWRFRLDGGETSVLVVLGGCSVLAFLLRSVAILPGKSPLIIALFLGTKNPIDVSICESSVAWDNDF